MRWSPVHSYARAQPRAAAPRLCSGAHQHKTLHRRKADAARASLYQLDTGAWVRPAPAGKAVKGTVHFLGGAFVGAAPQVAYNLFVRLIAAQGYTVITTPYELTFKHAECAEQTWQVYQQSLSEIRGSPSEAVSAPEGAPSFGVGHSNGALQHLIIGSLVERPHDANVIISFNNKQVSDAIPIPGFLDGLGPAVRAVRELQLPPAWLPPAPSPQQLLAAAAAALPPVLLDPRLLQGAAPAITQVARILDEVGGGTSDFTPTPRESRALVASRYSVWPTLLLRFSDDSIDETRAMAETLRQRRPGGVVEAVLPGSHVTPCGAEGTWQVGPSFTARDALLMAVRMVSQADVRRLSQRCTDFLDLAASGQGASVLP